jgi:hypothetical protein
LKVGGTFSTRTTFTDVLNSWLVGSFGDKSRYKIYRTSGCYLEYECQICRSVGVTIQVHIHRKTVSGKKIATGCPVSITQWTRCDCETLPTTIVSLPSVGDTFSSRHEFTTAIARYCSTNRTCLYATEDTGLYVSRFCTKPGCPGLVVVRLVQTTVASADGTSKPKPKMMPPLTVTKSRSCQPGCAEIGGPPTFSCLLCSISKPVASSVRCCHMTKDAVGEYCGDCLRVFFLKRSLKELIWNGVPGNYKNKMVWVGTDPDQMWYTCFLHTKRWTATSTFFLTVSRTTFWTLCPVAFQVSNRGVIVSFFRPSMRHTRRKNVTCPQPTTWTIQPPWISSGIWWWKS